MENKKCYKCNHIQEVNDKNIYQDITGKFTVCENCTITYNVEVKDKEY